MKAYRYEGQTFEDTDAGRLNLALALVQNEPGVYDDYDYELWVNEHETASGILWRVKEYGYDEAVCDLFTEFEDWYAQENRDDLLHDFSDSYEVVEPDEEDEEDEA